MKLSPIALMFLGSGLILGGIAVLADFSLTKAAVYLGALLIALLLFF